MPVYLTRQELQTLRQNATSSQARTWIDKLIRPEAMFGMHADLQWITQPAPSGADMVCPDHNQPLVPLLNSNDALRCPIDGQTFTGPSRTSAIKQIRHEQLANSARSLALLGAIVNNERYTQRAIAILDGYADVYPDTPITAPDEFWKTGRMLPYFLLETTWCLSLLWAAEMLHLTGKADTTTWHRWRDRLFFPCVETFMHQVPLVHNIRCWLNTLTGSVGLAFGDKQLIHHAFDAELGLKYQLTRGLLESGNWCETATLYQLYCLQAIVLLTESMKRSDKVDASIERNVQRMTHAAVHYLLPDGRMMPVNDSEFDTRLSPWLCATLLHVTKHPQLIGLCHQRLAEFENELDTPSLLPPSLCRNGARAHVDLLLPVEPISQTTPLPPARGRQPAPTRNVPANVVNREHQRSSQALRIEDKHGNLAFMEHGPKAASHMHYERLSLCLWLKGKAVLVDRGSVGYHLNIYNFYRYTPAHNTMSLATWHHLHDTPSQVLDAQANSMSASVPIHQGIQLTRTCTLEQGKLRDALQWNAAIEMHSDTMVDVYYHPPGRPAFDVDVNAAVRAEDFAMPYFGFTQMQNPRPVALPAARTLVYHNAGYQIHMTFTRLPKGAQTWLISTPGVGSQPGVRMESLVLRCPFANVLDVQCVYEVTLS